MLLRPPTIHGEALSPESHMSSQPGVAQPNKPKAKKKESSLSLKKDQVQITPISHEVDNVSINSNGSRASHQKPKVKESSLMKKKQNEQSGNYQTFSNDNLSVNSTGSKNSHRKKVKQSSFNTQKPIPIIQTISPQANKVPSFKQAIMSGEDSIVTPMVREISHQRSPKVIQYRQDFRQINAPTTRPRQYEEERPVAKLRENSEEKPKQQSLFQPQNPQTIVPKLEPIEAPSAKQTTPSILPISSFGVISITSEENERQSARLQRRNNIFGNKKQLNNDSRMQSDQSISGKAKSKTKIGQLVRESRQSRSKQAIQVMTNSSNQNVQIVPPVRANSPLIVPFTESVQHNLELNLSKSNSGQQLQPGVNGGIKESVLFNFEPEKKKGLTLTAHLKQNNSDSFVNINDLVSKQLKPSQRFPKISGNLQSRAIHRLGSGDRSRERSINKSEEKPWQNSGIIQPPVTVRQPQQFLQQSPITELQKKEMSDQRQYALRLRQAEMKKARDRQQFQRQQRQRRLQQERQQAFERQARQKKAQKQALQQQQRQRRIQRLKKQRQQVLKRQQEERRIQMERQQFFENQERHIEKEQALQRQQRQRRNQQQAWEMEKRLQQDRERKIQMERQEAFQRQEKQRKIQQERQEAFDRQQRQKRLQQERQQTLQRQERDKRVQQERLQQEKEKRAQQERQEMQRQQRERKIQKERQDALDRQERERKIEPERKDALETEEKQRKRQQEKQDKMRKQPEKVSTVEYPKLQDEQTGMKQKEDKMSFSDGSNARSNSSKKGKGRKKQSTLKITKPKKANMASLVPYTEESFYQNEPSAGEPAKEQPSIIDQCLVQSQHQKQTEKSNFDEQRLKSITDVNFYNYSNSQTNIKPPASKPPLSRASNVSSSKGKSKPKQSSLQRNNVKATTVYSREPAKKLTLLERAMAKDDSADGSNSQASFDSQDRSVNSQKSKQSKKSSKKETTINLMSNQRNHSKNQRNLAHQTVPSIYEQENFKEQGFDLVMKSNRQNGVAHTSPFIPSQRSVISKGCTYIDEKGRLVTKDVLIKGNRLIGLSTNAERNGRQAYENLKKSREKRSREQRSRSRSRQNRTSARNQNNNEMSSSAAESFYEDSKMSYARDNLPYASNLKNNTTNRVEYGYTDNITPNTLREFLKPIEQVPIHNQQKYISRKTQTVNREKSFKKLSMHRTQKKK